MSAIQLAAFNRSVGHVRDAQTCPQCRNRIAVGSNVTGFDVVNMDGERVPVYVHRGCERGAVQRLRRFGLNIG